MDDIKLPEVEFPQPCPMCMPTGWVRYAEPAVRAYADAKARAAVLADREQSSKRIWELSQKVMELQALLDMCTPSGHPDDGPHPPSRLCGCGECKLSFEDSEPVKQPANNGAGFDANRRGPLPYSYGKLDKWK